MDIKFDNQRWQKVKQNWSDFWQGTLERPLIAVWLPQKDKDKPEPPIPYQRFTANYGPQVSADQIIDRWHYELCNTQFLGDAFPHVWPNFGPGVLAEFLGAEMVTAPDTVWFKPSQELPIEQLELNYNPHSPVCRRINEIITKANDRWQGMVQIGATDMGGSLDILSTFRPSEKLLLDLYDKPDEVERLAWQIHKAWHEYFADQQKLKTHNPGYSEWAYMFSQKPYCMLQCDFAYMISPDHFARFVLPELKATIDKLGNSFYHLDGAGQLAHLDMLLDIEKLDGIQWIPGDGAEQIDKWPEVYQKIHSAGKRIQIISGQTDKPFDILDILADQIGSAKNIAYTVILDDPAHYDDAVKMLEKYKAI